MINPRLESRRFFISIAGGPETPCEELGLDPISLRRANLDIDFLEMEQHRVRGQWAVTLPHDADIRFYDYKAATDNLQQVFMGRVLSPQEAGDAGSRNRIVRVAGVGELLRQLRFHRGQFVPGRVGGPVRNPWEAVDRGVTVNGHIVPMWWGAYLANDPAHPGERIKLYRRQTVRRAIDEVFLNLQYLLPWHGGITNVWSPTLQSLALPTGTNQPLPKFEESTEGTYLDWLVRLLQPVPDAWMRWDYSGERPQASVGRFGDVAPVVLGDGWPVLDGFVERQRHQESLGLRVMLGSSQLSVEEFNRGYGNRVAWADFPAAAPRNTLRRQTAILFFGQEAADEWMVQADAQAIAAFAGPFLTGPMVSGTLRVAGAPAWCQPGAVIQREGVRVNVQETVLDLATNTVTASLGVPRHLGVSGIPQLGRWTQQAYRAMPGVVTGG
jgi:hypothetical protein